MTHWRIPATRSRWLVVAALAVREAALVQTLHNIMQIGLPALKHPPIDSTPRWLGLIFRPVRFFFWLPASLWTTQSALNRGGKRKVTLRWWLKDRYHFYNIMFPWQPYSTLWPPEGLRQFTVGSKWLHSSSLQQRMVRSTSWAPADQPENGNGEKNVK